MHSSFLSSSHLQNNLGCLINAFSFQVSEGEIDYRSESELAREKELSGLSEKEKRRVSVSNEERGQENE